MEKKKKIYEGTLNIRDYKIGAEKLIINAASLVEDARFLLKENRISSAIALAIIAIEEIGKIGILFRVSECDENCLKNYWSEYNKHEKKMDAWIVEHMRDRGKFDPLENSDNEKRRTYAKALNLLKQYSLYVDCIPDSQDRPKWRSPVELSDREITRDIAERIVLSTEEYVQRAKIAIDANDQWRISY